MESLNPMIDGFAMARAVRSLTLTSHGSRGYF